jgi:hypothetical protein
MATAHWINRLLVVVVPPWSAGPLLPVKHVRSLVKRTIWICSHEQAPCVALFCILGLLRRAVSDGSSTLTRCCCLPVLTALSTSKRLCRCHLESLTSDAGRHDHRSSSHQAIQVAAFRGVYPDVDLLAVPCRRLIAVVGKVTASRNR